MQPHNSVIKIWPYGACAPVRPSTAGAVYRLYEEGDDLKKQLKWRNLELWLSQGYYLVLSFQLSIWKNNKFLKIAIYTLMAGGSDQIFLLLLVLKIILISEVTFVKKYYKNTSIWPEALCKLLNTSYCVLFHLKRRKMPKRQPNWDLPAGRRPQGSTELGSDPIRPSSLQVWFVLGGRERERALTPDSLTGRVLDKKVNQKTDKETPARVMDRRSKQEANCYESHPMVQIFR